MRRKPGKDEDFNVFNLTIERRSYTKKYLAAEYSASEEWLFGEFLSNKGENFLRFKCNNDSDEKWCFVPLSSDDSCAALDRKYYGVVTDDPVLSKWRIFYYYDSDKQQLIAAFSNYYSCDQDDQQVYILILQ